MSAPDHLSPKERFFGKTSLGNLSNLIEVIADERWDRLVEQQGVAYAKTVAEAMNLKLDMGNAVDREKLRRAVLDLVAGRKMRKQKAHG